MQRSHLLSCSVMLCLFLLLKQLAFCQKPTVPVIQQTQSVSTQIDSQATSSAAVASAESLSQIDTGGLEDTPENTGEPYLSAVSLPPSKNIAGLKQLDVQGNGLTSDLKIQVIGPGVTSDVKNLNTISSSRAIAILNLPALPDLTHTYQVILTNAKGT